LRAPAAFLHPAGWIAAPQRQKPQVSAMHEPGRNESLMAKSRPPRHLPPMRNSTIEARPDMSARARTGGIPHAGHTNSGHTKSGHKVFAFEDLRLGQRDTLMRTVMERDVALFAEVSGDDNPVHLCETYAASTRFGQRIAHGMFTASLISSVLGTKLPGPGAVYLSQSLTFIAPVKIGDVVAASVEVAELVPERRRVRLSCQCIVDGKLVLEGEAWVAMPPVPRSAA
jgi:3-hydroxybutyryl-CoA dehydratase